MRDDEPGCSTQDEDDENNVQGGSGVSMASAVSASSTEEVEAEEDIVDLCRRLDTQLEEKAKMHNLNALNVKSILHRLIKDPHVLSALMGIKGDMDDIPTLKVTRSKVKHSTEPAKVELRPVPPPRTFLDVQFENEDDDEDYRPEDVQSDESEDDEEGNDTLTANDPERTHDQEEGLDKTMVAANRSDDVANDNLLMSDLRESSISPYQLRSRVPHVEENIYDSLVDSFSQDAFDTFVDYSGQEMLTFVENPDYLDFLQGIQASTPIESGNTPGDDDDPDDEEYNVLTELERLRELEKDKDELRMDRFTEIPMREVEGLFLDLIGDDVETIQPELMAPKNLSPKKKRTTKRRSSERNGGRKSADEKTLPVDEPPPDGSYSCSIIKGGVITFNPEELEQLRIQLEQHVQLLTQSVVMCYHDTRLTHMKNQYQLMINELDSHYYEAGPSSLFNISNLAAAIESCHDIIGVTPVSDAFVRWDPTPFGWSPRPEAALVLGRSRAVIYPDLLPGVQPDLFEFPHQFFTAGEDLLLAHALVQFRHIPNSTSQDPFGRLYWVQRMLLPCKTLPQIRSHLRVARHHVEGQVNNRNPMYQIIMQALRGVCHLRFPFEQPVARYDTMQMWPEELRPIWFNKFLKHFMTCGPTMIKPVVKSMRKDRTRSPAVIQQGPEMIAEKGPPEERRKRLDISSTSVSYKVDVCFYGETVAMDASATVRPYAIHFEFISACFTVPCTSDVADSGAQPPTTSPPLLVTCVKDDPEMHGRLVVARSSTGDQACSEVSHEMLENPSPELPDRTFVVVRAVAPSASSVLQEIAAGPSTEHMEFSVYEPEKEFQTVDVPHPEDLQVPKSEFSVGLDLEEGEILSGENSLEVPPPCKKPRRKSSRSPERCRSRQDSHSAQFKRARPIAKSKSPPPKRRRGNWSTTASRQSAHPNSGTSLRGRLPARDRGVSGYQEHISLRSRRSRRQSSDSDWEPRPSSARGRRTVGRGVKDQVEVVRRSSRRNRCPIAQAAHEAPSRRGLNSEAERMEGASHMKSRGQSYGKKCSAAAPLRPEPRCSRSKETSEHQVASCSLNVTFGTQPSCGSAMACLDIKQNTSVSVMEELRVDVASDETAAVMEMEDAESARSCPRVDSEVCGMEILSSSWKDGDFLYEDYDFLTSRTLDSGVLEFDSPYIPRTPTFNTPSNYSPVGTIYNLSGSRSRSPGSDDFGVPVTPRDDARTRSPTLLRAPSAVSRALFAKVEFKRISMNGGPENVDLTCSAPSAGCWKETWECGNGEPLPHENDFLDARPSSAFNNGDENIANEYSEDAPGSEMYSAENADDIDAGGKTRMKRRTRNEKERMGLERMQNPHHRARQMVNLAKKIAVDVKQRTFMHQDVWRSVERIVLGQENMESQFDRLKAVLLPNHADVLALLSLLADESVLPPELLTSPLRRAYHGAVQILLAIEAYCHGTRSRSSNTRSLLKTIGTMGQTLGETEFCDRLADLLGNERPLWGYIRQWLPLPYDEKVAPADFEFIDLCKRSDSEFVEDGGAECVDDLNAVLGVLPPRRGGPLQVTAGQLNTLQNGVYIPILISKEKPSKEPPQASEKREPTWTKESDMMLLKTYNEVEGGVEEVVSQLAQKLPYSPADIERRLNFLISLF